MFSTHLLSQTANHSLSLPQPTNYMAQPNIPLLAQSLAMVSQEVTNIVNMPTINVQQQL
jgi:hypothetical protein